MNILRDNFKGVLACGTPYEVRVKITNPFREDEMRYLSVQLHKANEVGIEQASNWFHFEEYKEVMKRTLIEAQEKFNLKLISCNG